MLDFLHDNPFASGLVFTTLLAATLAYMRNVPQRLWRYLWSQFAVCAEIKNTDPSFNWISLWLDQQPYSKKARQLSVYTYNKSDHTDDIYCPDDSATAHKNRPKVLFTPSQGEHFFWYKGRLVWLSRSKAEPAGQGSSFLERESFNIWVLGRSQEPIRTIIDDAMELALPKGTPETCVIPSADGRWQSAIRRKPRARNSVILDGNQLDILIDDAQAFLKSKAWYHDLGIPYRRGYLMHGVPGTGKTSAVLAIAGELGLDVYMLNLGDRYIDDGRLNYLLSQVPPGNIVLLEDIDSAFQSREKEPKSAKLGGSDPDTTPVTFSGLLNALDGVAAQEGRLLFLTTNHKDILDPALVRPGRADVHVAFGFATASQAERMFTRFFPSVPKEVAERFGQMTPKDTVSMATIQDHLLSHKTDPEAALAAWYTAFQH